MPKLIRLIPATKKYHRDDRSDKKHFHTPLRKKQRNRSFVSFMKLKKNQKKD